MDWKWQTTPSWFLCVTHSAILYFACGSCWYFLGRFSILYFNIFFFFIVRFVLIQIFHWIWASTTNAHTHFICCCFVFVANWISVKLCVWLDGFASDNHSWPGRAFRFVNRWIIDKLRTMLMHFASPMCSFICECSIISMTEAINKITSLQFVKSDVTAMLSHMNVFCNTRVCWWSFNGMNNLLMFAQRVPGQGPFLCVVHYIVRQAPSYHKFGGILLHCWTFSSWCFNEHRPFVLLP